MATIDTAANLPSKAEGTSILSLMNHERWIEVGRIVLTGAIAFVYWQQFVPLYVLWAAVLSVSIRSSRPVFCSNKNIGLILLNLCRQVFHIERSVGRRLSVNYSRIVDMPIFGRIP